VSDGLVARQFELLHNYRLRDCHGARPTDDQRDLRPAVRTAHQMSSLSSDIPTGGVDPMYGTWAAESGHIYAPYHQTAQVATVQRTLPRRGHSRAAFVQTLLQPAAVFRRRAVEGLNERDAVHVFFGTSTGLRTCERSRELAAPAQGVAPASRTGGKRLGSCGRRLAAAVLPRDIQGVCVTAPWTEFVLY
jgi:hypothetical protein